VKLPSGLQPLLEPHRAYLKGRGFDPDATAKLWGLRSIGMSGRLQWRIWIPITLDGELVSWTTRSIGRHTFQRYVSARPDEEVVPHKSVLYGADLARHAVIVCEGPTDAWRIGPGGCCLFGLNWTAEQVTEIGSFPVRAICFDRGEMSRARRLASELEGWSGETHVVELESGDDPATADPEELAELRELYLD